MRCACVCLANPIQIRKQAPFALEVMQQLNDKCKEWKEAENISYSVYGTPMESTTYKFAKCLQKRFGIIKGVTDKNYITNSYHVHVTEKIDAFKQAEIRIRIPEACLRVERSATSKYRICRTIFRRYSPLCSIFMIISCMRS